METLKYKVIRSREQYNLYCKTLEEILDSGYDSGSAADEVDLLALLIEKWDDEHTMLQEVDPIRLLHSLMEDHKMKARDLVILLDVSKGYISDILHYKKGLSKEVIRKLAERFKVRQDAFNRPYKLKLPATIPAIRQANTRNSRKKIQVAR